MMGKHEPQKGLFSDSVDLDKRARKDHPRNFKNYDKRKITRKGPGMNKPKGTMGNEIVGYSQTWSIASATLFADRVAASVPQFRLSA